MAGPLDKVLHPTDQTKIVDAIRNAERVTSGEIKVHVERAARAATRTSARSSCFSGSG